MQFQGFTAGSVVLILAAFVQAGCSNTYYNMWEKFGYHKRDILVERVENAREGQEAAKTQFQTTLDKFKSVTNFSGGNLEAKYNELNAEYERCEKRAAAVSSQIASVNEVAQSLFKEWEGELAQYSNPELKAKSQEEMQATKSRYGQLISAMRAAEAKMKPVQSAFRDQVLFLKHNLNAQAIASLEGTRVTLQADVERLIADMQKSIDESNKFISSMKKS